MERVGDGVSKVGDTVGAGVNKVASTVVTAVHAASSALEAAGLDKVRNTVSASSASLFGLIASGTEAFSADYYVCAKQCGFEGSFDVVSLHEATCNAVSPATGCAHENPDIAEEGQLYVCNNNCGFEGSFESVSEHEKTCRSRFETNVRNLAHTLSETAKQHVSSLQANFRPTFARGNSTANSEDASAGTYQCNFNCGFEGAFDTVLAHEKVCGV